MAKVKLANEDILDICIKYTPYYFEVNHSFSSINLVCNSLILEREALKQHLRVQL